ncbi:penicillin-binding protein 1C [Seohaeicola zhoushanensis]|uniref:peptidoglycan glycosyltransferase n=1 Tax=Seohaeicola zhoushanensis TaxID=1569283 RepID=A0A8J3GVZ5_9RHOB|nr:penicillin-binding protein 1C [Seohaeicola zhoushanensis]GHF41675.1 penicillin-binding protein 1C [Seohaeicola zhoushanensis]
MPEGAPHRWFFGLALALGLAGASRDAADAWIDATVLPPVLAETSVETRDRNGQLLRAYQVGNGIWRLAVTPAEVDAAYVGMLLRYEDKRFLTHQGVDPLALLRAVGQAVVNGDTVSGGSTLTMQVARLIEDGPTGRWAGKLRQMRVALALERRLSKDEILRLYLTHAPFGGNIEGLRAATFAWFGKEPRRLTPAEAALLVALPQSPETRRPDRNAAAARAARDRVLARSAAQGALEAGEAAAALRSPVPTAMRPFPQLAAHLGDRMRAEAPDLARHDLTVDATVQAAMERLLAEAVRGAGPRVSVALVAVDHQTGEIIASVGSPAYAAEAREGYVDMTQAVRSPGSLLKPLIYGLAFDQGLAHPETLIHDGPVTFGRYAPRNFDGQFRGDIRVREALQQSLNIPVVRLAEVLGPARITAALERSGARLHIPGGKPGLAIALGGLGITLEDLVQLYAALAEGGQGVGLNARLGAAGALHQKLISPEAAWQVGHILAGLTPPPGAPSGVVAYKTGTSYGHRDAWAIGYDGRHVIGVWMGRPDGTPVPGAFGGDLAAPVLFDAFGRLKQGFERLPPPPPATLIVTAAELPLPLQRFRPRDAAFEAAAGGVELTFPPDGARLALGGGPVTLKLRGGAAPFSVLANGRPVATGAQGREIEIAAPGRGFSTLVVIDRAGSSSRVTVQLD